LSKQLPQKSSEQLGLGEAPERAVEGELAATEQTLQTINEFAAEDGTQDADWQKEARRRANPA
jgi:hypothetical protein